MSLTIKGPQAFEPNETFLVGSLEGAQYPTINDALTVAASSPRTEDNRAIIYVSPGKYTEDVFLPDFIYLVGVASGVHIAGSNDSTMPMVDIAQGVALEKITVAPTLVNKPCGIAIRDATMLVGGVIGSPINGTLIVSGNDAETQETFTFTGEATTAAVVALINATAINVQAINRFGKVAIMSNEDKLKIFDTGTANAALGFLTTTQTKSRANMPTVYITDVSVIGQSTFAAVTDQKDITTGVLAEDRILGSIIANGLSISGADETASGIGLNVKRGSTILSNVIISGVGDGGSGIKLEDDPNTAGLTQVIIGTAILTGNGTDIVVESNTKALIMYVGSGMTFSGAGELFASGGTEGINTDSSWFLGVDGTPMIDSMVSLVEYARKTTISADELFSPATVGAADVEYGLQQRVKEFATGVDREVTGKRKHPSTPTGQAATSVKLKITLTIDVSGAGSDVVRLVAEVASVPVGSDMAAPPVETVTIDEDVSSIVADKEFEVEFEFTSTDAVPQPGETSLIKVRRNGAHGNDTYGNKLHLWEWEWEV